MPWTPDDDHEDDFDDAELVLPETRLRVQGDHLVRLNEDGSTSLRIPLLSIEDVSFRLKFDPTVLVFAVGTAVLMAIGKYVSSTNWISVVLYLLATVTGMIALFAVFDKVITIDRKGEPLEIVCSENSDQVRGFLASLQELLHDAR